MDDEHLMGHFVARGDQATRALVGCRDHYSALAGHVDDFYGRLLAAGADTESARGIIVSMVAERLATHKTLEFGGQV